MAPLLTAVTQSWASPQMHQIATQMLACHQHLPSGKFCSTSACCEMSLHFACCISHDEWRACIGGLLAVGQCPFALCVSTHSGHIRKIFNTLVTTFYCRAASQEAFLKAEGLKTMGNHAFFSKDLPKAVGFYSQALHLNPTSPMLHTNR